MNLKISLDAILADIPLWTDLSDSLTDAKATAQGLVLDQGAFSFAGGPAYRAYEEHRATLVAYLEEGARQTEAGATRLEEVHDIYQGTDEAAQRALDGVWDVP